MGRLLAIAIHRRKRGPMIELERAGVTPERGVADDFRGAPGKRQVTVLGREGWEAALRECGLDLPWTARRANLLVEGLDLERSAGRLLAIGPVRLRVTRETDPCERMAEIDPALERALRPRWRGGVCCRVEQGGEIAPGEEARWIDEA